jgi:phage shock protein A|tara:strand:+ start:707 stop:850 length:144 start_codon:yes stop_codon:yes gene_type:complete
MVVTRTELTEVVDQVNAKFAQLENKIKELEKLLETPVAKKTVSKKAA